MNQRQTNQQEYHKAHAEHNNAAIKLLDKNPGYLDWVVTICFYTCLHAIKYKAFPMTVKATGGKSYTLNSFEDYCRSMDGRLGDKHAKLSDLVNSYHVDISAEFSQLKDICWIARYENYYVERTKSNFAKGLKDKILNYCFQ